MSDLNRPSGPTNYTNNSQKAKASPTKKAGPASADRPKLEKVVSAVPIERKKTFGRKFAETFTGDDVKNVGRYLLLDVVLPDIKSMIVRAGQQGLERLFFGESSMRRTGNGSGFLGTRNGSSAVRDYTPYNRMGSASESRARQHAPVRRFSEEIILGSRQDAERVLVGMEETLGMYDRVLLSDLKDLLGVTGGVIDNAWGWTDLTGAAIRQVKEGWLLELPREQEVN